MVSYHRDQYYLVWLLQDWDGMRRYQAIDWIMDICYTGVGEVSPLYHYYNYYVKLLFLLIGKPWLPDGLYSSYWLPYKPVACSGHGSCDLLHNIYYCNCHHGYSGLTCNERQ